MKQVVSEREIYAEMINDLIGQIVAFEPLDMRQVCVVVVVFSVRLLEKCSVHGGSMAPRDMLGVVCVVIVNFSLWNHLCFWVFLGDKE
jgi:hypothetical protein